MEARKNENKQRMGVVVGASAAPERKKREGRCEKKKEKKREER